MRRALALSMLLLTVGLAGCLGGGEDAPPTDPSAAVGGAGLSEKIYDILPGEEVWIPSTVDDKRMNTVVYRPDTNETVPVFINFSPYWGDSATERGDNFAQYMIEEYVPRGYAVVLAAIRGTGHSEGCFQIAGDLELQDMHDVITHFAEASWSNGKIAAGGKSYDSTPQNGLVAKFDHPALEGIFHVSGITDMYRYNYRQGVAYSHGTLFNTYYYLQGTDEYGASFLSTPTPENTMSEDEESLARIVDDAACTELPEMQASGIGSGAHGMKDAYWIERDWNRYIGESTWNGSIFFVHGFQDWNVKPDHILPWLDLLPSQVEVKGWLHQDTENNGHVYPMRTDWNRTMLQWLDHELKGKDTGLTWGYEAQGSDGVWRASGTWPPAMAQETTYGLTDLAEATPPEATATVLSGQVDLAGDQAPLRYAGAPSVSATVTVDGNQDPVFTAVLYDEGPGGERTWINEAVLRGVYRGGLESPEPVPQGEPLEVTLPFYPQDDVLEPGHRWVVELGAMPQHAQPTPAQLQGVTYEGQATELVLPVAPVDTAVDVQPTPTTCFAC